MVALRPIALIGSPKYRILSKLVLLFSVNRLPMSLAIFLPISPPKPVNNPPSENPIAETRNAPVANSLATPRSDIEFLTIALPNDERTFPLTTGAPNVLN